MLRLTDYETGDLVMIDRELIVAVIPLKAEVFAECTDEPHEHGRRTRIDRKDGGYILVRETSQEIHDLLMG